MIDHTTPFLLYHRQPIVESMLGMDFSRRESKSMQAWTLQFIWMRH
ncbi:hypothetical protein [Ktedonobacter sp. SOSP1-85]|nr:hypothetical protein [Ktedonobacter sp. SOSP1-85]